MVPLSLMMALLLCIPTQHAAPQKRPVFVSASFLGKDRLYVEDVSREEVRIYENGQPREIEFFAGAEVPAAYGILFDRDILPEPFDEPRRIQERVPVSMAATNVAFQVLDQVLGRQVGWAASYDTEMRVVVDFTQDSGRIKDALQGLRSKRSIEESSLYSAVFAATKKMSLRNEKRRILAVFLNVIDMKSGDKLKVMKNLVSASNVELFIASFASSRYGTGRGMPPMQSEACLRELVGVTAGGAFFTSVDGIDGIGRRISNQIRTLYTIGFESQTSTDQPSTLKIECTRSGVKVASHPVVPNL